MGSMLWRIHQARVSASCCAKRSFESCHSLGGRREEEEGLWRGRLVGAVDVVGMRVEERFAGRVAYFDWESCRR